MAVTRSSCVSLISCSHEASISVRVLVGIMFGNKKEYNYTSHPIPPAHPNSSDAIRLGKITAFGLLHLVISEQQWELTFLYHLCPSCFCLMFSPYLSSTHTDTFAHWMKCHVCNITYTINNTLLSDTSLTLYTSWYSAQASAFSKIKTAVWRDFT